VGTSPSRDVDDIETSETADSAGKGPVARTGEDFDRLLKLVDKHKNEIPADFTHRLRTLPELGHKPHWRDLGNGVIFNQHIRKPKDSEEVWYAILAQRQGMGDTPSVTAVIQQSRRGLSRAPATLENQPFIGNILFPHKTFFGPNDEGTYETWMASPGSVSLPNEPQTSRHISAGVGHYVQSHLPANELDPKHLDLSKQLAPLSNAEKNLYFFKTLSLDHDLTDELRGILERGRWSLSPVGKGLIHGAQNSPPGAGPQRAQTASWFKSGNDWKLIQLISKLESEGYSSHAQLLKGTKQKLAQLELRERFRPVG
jgi:hypothetical protein